MWVLQGLQNKQQWYDCWTSSSVNTQIQTSLKHPFKLQTDQKKTRTEMTSTVHKEESSALHPPLTFWITEGQEQHLDSWRWCAGEGGGNSITQLKKQKTAHLRSASQDFYPIWIKTEVSQKQKNQVKKKIKVCSHISISMRL